MANDDAQKLKKVALPDDWKQVLAPRLLSDEMARLRAFLHSEYEQKTIYPPKSQLFAALNATPLSQVKVVILGQDPYHGAGQAMGLSFSVPKVIPKPPSLQNILKELAVDLGLPISPHGDLTYWANQGVLLLNSVLSVEAGRPTSHQGQGWEGFSDDVIAAVDQYTEHSVFILWGAHAKKKGRYIDTNRHLVLDAVHPSPLAANRGGFFGCRHFSATNAYLQSHGKTPIDWRLPL